MQAVRFHGKEDVRVEEVEEPAPGPGEVKLRNAYFGICGSDLHVFYSPEASGLDFSRPHPLTGSTPPQILGHEFAGTVVAIGDGVEGYDVGDRAAVWPVYYCGHTAPPARTVASTSAATSASTASPATAAAWPSSPPSPPTCCTSCRRRSTCA